MVKLKVYLTILIESFIISANLTKWSNTLKQVVELKASRLIDTLIDMAISSSQKSRQTKNIFSPAGLTMVALLGDSIGSKISAHCY